MVGRFERAAWMGALFVVGATVAWAATPSTPVTTGNVPLFDTAGHAGYVQGTVTAAQVQADSVAKGGAITLGGTAQTLAAVNSSRKGIIIQNPCTATEQGIAVAENLYINFTAAATVSTSANVAVLPPCSSFALGLNNGVITTELISVNAATTAHIWYSKEF